MSASDRPTGGAPGADPADIAREIAVTAASLSLVAQDAGLVIVSRLLNLVRIEAEIKVREFEFRPPAADSPANKGPGGRT